MQPDDNSQTTSVLAFCILNPSESQFGCTEAQYI